MFFTCALVGRSCNHEFVAQIAERLQAHRDPTQSGQIQFHLQRARTGVPHVLKAFLVQRQAVGVFGMGSGQRTGALEG